MPTADTLSESALAMDMTSGSMTGATLASFVIAFVHFSTEVLFFKTLSWKSAANPMAVAGM